MKSVLLSGGLGTRLWPLTKVTNKHLLPVYDKPMIYYPIQTLVDSGINDILLVCGGNAAGEFLRILGNGEHFNLKHLHYRYQKEASGIADALSLAEEWANGEPIVVILADNILENPFPEHVKEFEANPVGARIFLSEVDNPKAYGIAEMAEDGSILSIEEKPADPKSNLAIIGVYMYDSSVWDFIKRLKPSARGELEITDVNKYYLDSGKLKAYMLEGHWFDCGESFDMYLDSQVMIRELSRR